MASVRKIRCVVLISGRGTNLSSIIQAAKSENYPAKIVTVIANNPEASGLLLAQQAGINTQIVNSKDITDRSAYDALLQTAIDQHDPDLVVLAGFMRILTSAFVNQYAGRMINIHPSLLPSFPGLNTHQRAIDAGVCVHGCTVHFVTPVLDHGPIIAQAVVPVFSTDSAQDLAKRVLEQEHQVLPEVIRWFAEGKLQIEGQRVKLTDEVLAPNGLIVPKLS